MALAWLDHSAFDCGSCKDKELLGHYKPARRPVPWDPPPGFYEDPAEGGFDPMRFRCPKLYVSPWVNGVADAHFHLQLGAPPLAGGSGMWPAKLREAVAFFDLQLGGKRAQVEEDRRKKLERDSRRSR